MPVAQVWDFDNPCRACGYVHLVSTKSKFRHICCMNGRALYDPYPQLRPLPNRLQHICVNLIEHMSSKSAYYNNILSIAQTTVDNGRTNRYEQINGPHAIKLNGRVIHTIPRNTPTDRRGLSYFTYDGAAQRMKDHVDDINAKRTNENHNIRFDLLSELYEEMKSNNQYVKQVIKFIVTIMFYLSNNMICFIQ
jgi:hypothetical protein